MERTTRKDTPRIAAYVLWMVYGIACAYLYYRQTKWTGGSVFESDLPAHIKMVIEDHWYYSLTAFVYRFLYLFPIHDLLIALFLGIMSVFAVAVTAVLLRYFQLPEELTGFLALILNLVMPIFIPGVADGRYIGMQSASIWHNSTYIVMKPLAVICFLLYLQLEQEISEKLPVKKAVIFSLMLVLTTAVKPSYLVVFAPVMLFFMIADLFKKVPFWRLFTFGCCVLPSLGVILLQNAVLFGAQTDSGIIIAPGLVVRAHSGHPFVAAGLSILFPLAVLIFSLQDLVKDRIYRFIWALAFVGYGEMFLLSESGHRSLDGNFMWGYFLVILLLFAVSVKKLYEKKDRPGAALEVVGCACTLALHLYYGMHFFIALLKGISYHMWT